MYFPPPDPDKAWAVLMAVVAGAAGGVVRATSQRAGIKQLCADVTVGAILAVYLGDIAEEVIRPVLGLVKAETAADQLGPFLCGVGGMFLVEIIMAALRLKRRQLEGDDEKNDR